MILAINSSFPKVHDFSGMSSATAMVVWTMIAFLVIIVSVFGIYIFKNFANAFKKNKLRSKEPESKGFGSFSK